MTEDASEEAAWRDLVAHYATPAVTDGVAAPWPTREDLPGPGSQGPEAAGPDASGPDTADLDVSGLDMAGPESAELDGTQQPGPRLGPRPGPFGWPASRAAADPHRPARQRHPATTARTMITSSPRCRRHCRGWTRSPRVPGWRCSAGPATCSSP